MLLNNLFLKENQEFTNNELITTMNLVKNHAVFQGHFPGQPVLPGVSMIQVSKELLEEYLGFPLIMKSSRQIKFLHVVNPEETPQVVSKIKWDLQEEDMKYKAAIQLIAPEGHTIFKMQCDYEKMG